MSREGRKTGPMSDPVRPEAREPGGAFVPRPFDAGARMSGVDAERAGAASQIRRTLDAWRGPREFSLQLKSSSSSSGREANAELHEQARAGVSGASGKLPHFDLIQKSFGAHDVGGIHAHLDDQAASATGRMGARGFAAGDRVAFAGAPDLHTAAHEAAHVIQQRGGVQLAGGVGREHDDHERHADRVADLVVAGKSAESALDERAPRRGGGGYALQMVKETRAPGGGRGAKVSDLDKASEDAAVAAIGGANRQGAIDAILDDGFVKGLSSRAAGVPVRYDAGGDGDYGTCHYDEKHTPKMWIEIYPPAFKDVSVLYSTIRHELIHASQNRSTIADKDKVGEAKATPTDVTFTAALFGGALADAGSEVETHAWEILNAASTGIDDEFLYTRCVALRNHWNAFNKAKKLEGGKTTGKKKVKKENKPLIPRKGSQWYPILLNLYNQAIAAFEAKTHKQFPRKDSAPHTFADAPEIGAPSAPVEDERAVGAGLKKPARPKGAKAAKAKVEEKEDHSAGASAPASTGKAKKNGKEPSKLALAARGGARSSPYR